MRLFFWKVRGTFIWWKEIVEEEGWILAFCILKGIWLYDPEEDRDTY